MMCGGAWQIFVKPQDWRNMKPKTNMVVLRDINKYGKKSEAYKAPNGWYYSSEKAYEEIQKKRQRHKTLWDIETDSTMSDHDKCVEYIRTLLEYQWDHKLPTILYKKIEEYKPYGYDVIFRTMVDCTSSMQWALANKSFKNDSGKILYLFAIIGNNISNVFNRPKEDKIVVSKEPAPDIDEVVFTGESNDGIKKFLEDDEW